MLRQLLTLLAVISGFTLAAEPVSAADARAVSIAAAEAESVGVTIVSAAPEALLTAQECAADEPRRVIAVTRLDAPSVRLQADRARE
ncbi:hypothetical protein [Aurantiacibacter aquimixticola]|uniref:UrcA family protein n=1 Tax=Aurantiacibacter aquimixticola TaxID=1958945 RepID=A0A419RS76_9SPHN|nr:hypothetical protein [Aurantiacibacter aquimixticola]RJY08637.1 hypothetical protein D6201_04025 [Aurantiacibacter aquimixticola]